MHTKRRYWWSLQLHQRRRKSMSGWLEKRWKKLHGRYVHKPSFLLIVSSLLCYRLKRFARFFTIAQFQKCGNHPCRSVEACNLAKSNGTLWVFFTFFKLYKCFQFTESITLYRWAVLTRWKLFLSKHLRQISVLITC